MFTFLCFEIVNVLFDVQRFIFRSQPSSEFFPNYFCLREIQQNFHNFGSCDRIEIAQI